MKRKKIKTSSKSNSPPADQSSGFRKVQVFILLTAFFVFLPTLWADFVWDDYQFLVHNPAIQNIEGVIQSFTQADAYYAKHISEGLTAPMYRPMRQISWFIDYKIWGMKPAGFHLTNMLLHAAVCLILFRILHRLFHHLFASTLGSLLYAVHPVLTEAVAWIKGRDTLLCALFCLWAFLLFLQVCRKPISYQRWIGIILLYMAALLSYLQAVSLLGIFMVYLFLWRKKIAAKEIQRAAISLLVMILLTGGFLFLRHEVLGQTAQMDYLVEGSFLKTMTTMSVVMVEYFRLLVFPLQLNADYENFPHYTSPFHFHVIFSLLILMAICLSGILLYRRGSRRGVLGLLWLGGFLAPVSNLVPTMQLLAERFLYIPAIGLAVLIALLVQAIQNKWPWLNTKKISAGFGLIILLFIVRTELRLMNWQNEESLFKATLEADPDNCRALQNYGKALYNQGRFEDALPLLKHHVEKCPPNQSVFRTLGFSLIQTGQSAEALPLLEKATQEYPDSPELWLYLAMAAGEVGEKQTALQALERLQPIYQPDPATDFNIARVFQNIGQWNQARNIYLGILRHVPDQRFVLRRLAEVELAAGNSQKAYHYAAQWLQLSPEDSQARQLLQKIESILEKESE